MLNPLDIENYTTGKRARGAIEVLSGRVSLPDRMTMRLHTLARNHLVIMIALYNGARAGGLCNMTVEALKGSIYHEARDQHIVQVPTNIQLTQHISRKRHIDHSCTCANI